MQERNCVFYRLVASLNVVPYQLLTFGTTLNIHRHRLTHFQGLPTRNWRAGTSLTNGKIETHINRNELSGRISQKRLCLTRTHDGDIYALAVD
jgi:hypothetical protein